MAASRRGRVFRVESSTYEDPATGFEVTRLTDPAYSCLLPNSHYRFISSKHNFLLYSSDRGGTMQAFRLDLKSGRHRQITSARSLDPGCLTLFGNDKSFAFIDDGVLFQAGSKGGKPRKLFAARDGWQLSGGVDIDPAGRTGALAETRGGVSRLLLLDLKRRKAVPVTEQDGVLSTPMLRPGDRGILYRRNRDQLWVINQDGNGRRRLNLAPGRLGPIYWVAGARSFHYFSIPEGGNLPAIHEYWIEEEEDRLTVEAGQFVSFGPNGNSTVFIGARASLVSPHIVLLLPIGRELTICEHAASEEFAVTVVFSPDSRRIVYGSDRDGKPAIYTMMVDDLVEST